jgi:hypothetical protein
MIDYDDTPFGMVIVACSRFRPVCDVACPRTCAARLDRRDLPTQRLELADDDTAAHPI